MAANFATMVMHTLRNMGLQIGAFNPCLCRRAERHWVLFCHGDDFVVLGGDGDSVWFGKTLNESLIVKIRGALGPDERGTKNITLPNRLVRYGTTANGLPLEWKPDPRHAEIITEALGRRRAAKSKELSSLGINRSIEDMNHMILPRGVCVLAGLIRTCYRVVRLGGCAVTGAPSMNVCSTCLGELDVSCTVLCGPLFVGRRPQRPLCASC